MDGRCLALLALAGRDLLAIVGWAAVWQQGRLLGLGALIAPICGEVYLKIKMAYVCVCV